MMITKCNELLKYTLKTFCISFNINGTYLLLYFYTFAISIFFI